MRRLHFSISTKLNVLALPLIPMIFAVALIARQSLNHNAQALIVAREVKELSVRSLALLLIQDDASKALLMDPDNTAAGTRKIAAYDESHVVFQRISALTNSDELRRLLHSLEKFDEEQLRPLDVELLEVMASGDTSGSRAIYFTKYEPARSAYQVELRRLIDLAERQATAAGLEVSAQNERSLRNICLALVIGTLSALSIMWFCARRLVSLPVRGMAAEMRAIADNQVYDRDLNAALRSDELGESARAFSAVLEVVRESFGALRRANEGLERRVAERTAELQEITAQAAAVVRAAPDAVLVLNESWVICEFNSAAEHMFRCGRGEAVGQPLTEFVRPMQSQPADLFCPRPRPDPAELPGSAVHPIIGKRVEAIGVCASGLTTIPVEIGLAETMGVDGNSSRYVAFVRDLSLRKKAELERESLHNQLLDVSRRAGMAEVAAGVLHNIGNVLNSINVSAGLVAQTLKQSEVPSLAEVAEIIRAHEGDLARFLSEDEQGQHIPAYFVEVAASLVTEREKMLAEVHSLSERIDHVKEIVRSQQSTAKGSTLLEETAPSELVEIALRTQLDVMTADGVRLVRRLDDIPRTPLDKHKVLQILINFISNARKACRDAPAGIERICTVAACMAKTQDGIACVRFEVTDTGVGIPPENIEKLFQHGFTTRDDGHGFGLHSAANAAREMGGSLRASSDGPGKGASFFLELPMRASSETAIEQLRRQRNAAAA